MTDTAQELLERLCAGADPRRQRSLRLVHAVCEAQREHGSTDYSLTTLGRLSQARGGPAERALRNPAGAPYRRLIACHRAACGATPASKRSVADAEGLLEGIRDPVLRARIELLRDEVRAVRRQLQMAQQVVHASAVVTLSASADGDAGIPQAQLGRHVSVDLLPIERDALRTALDAPRLKSVGLTIDGRGRILLPGGRPAFPVGFATALAKIAAEFGAATPSDIGDRPVGDGSVGYVTDSTS